MEEWRRLIYNGIDYGDWYEVSNLGEIRNSNTHKVRRQTISKKGYCLVSGSVGSRADRPTFRVHRAVAEAFVKNPNNFPEVNHIDGCKTNNNVSNLEWCERDQNMKHASEHGLARAPFKNRNENPYAKLTEEDVEFIRNNYKPRDKEFGFRALSRKFGVTHQAIRKIYYNKQ